MRDLSLLRLPFILDTDSLSICFFQKCNLTINKSPYGLLRHSWARQPWCFYWALIVYTSWSWQLLWLMWHSDPWITTIACMLGFNYTSRVFLILVPLALPMILQALIFLYKWHFWLKYHQCFYFLLRLFYVTRVFSS